MMRLVLSAAVVAMSMSAPGLAQANTSKQVDCGHQGAIVAAVQQARLDRVRERDVQSHVLENANWPDNYNAAIPLIAGWVYSREIKMRDIRNKDLSAAWQELCLQQ